MIDDPLIGQQLANFRLERVLGRGGMAQVYYGRDVKLQRPVAVKVIDIRFRGNLAYAKRFVQEARAVASWRHENIVQVYYADEEDGLYYFAMEYINGVDLAQLLSQYAAEGGFIPHDDVLHIGRAIADALDYAHQKGVIHRDVKPSNVMVATDGRVVLTDFGLAMDVQQGSLGETFGTPHYVAPEQARRSADAVSQSDLYSLGVILYEMLVGTVPFDDPSPASVALQHMTLPPPPPRNLNPHLNLEIEQVLLKALSKLPGDRYQRGTELIDALEKALQSKKDQAPSEKMALPPLPAGVMPSPRLLSRISVAEKVALHQRSVSTPSAYPARHTQRTSTARQPLQHTSSGLFSYSPRQLHRKPALFLAVAGGLLVLIVIILAVLLYGLKGNAERGLQQANRGMTFTTATASGTASSSVLSGAAEVVTPTTKQSNSSASGSPELFQTTAPQTEFPMATSTETSTATPIQIMPTLTQTPTFTDTLPAPTAISILPSETPTIPVQPPAPTVAFPDGRPISLFYDDHSFYVWNPGDTLQIASLSFEALNTSGQLALHPGTGNPIRFDGSRWEQFYGFLESRACDTLEITQSPSLLRPSQCRTYNARVTPQARDSLVFWLPREADITEFRVLWNGQEVARCPVVTSGATRSCEVFLPR